ncbi:unnamed protein product [Sphenostylis stenocarpa]|uniref:Uncharacterized protein n=1 Tax=Sphenostylis stenocarpa TaxID=92480 RepID=A0AA86SA68_9FABA|nr:unnamed protein product [Sphenostylis stenocarpa]
MEESVAPKRPREEPLGNESTLDCDELQDSKKHKPYNHILSLLESEEDDSTQDLSPLITALQQEITDLASDSDTLLSQHTTTINNLQECSSSTTHCSSGIVEEREREMVMRHLLEASDDELGIPNKGGDGLLDLREDYGFNGGDMLSSICDGLWEFEDETANYYELLQSQLFL